MTDTRNTDPARMPSTLSSTTAVVALDEIAVAKVALTNCIVLDHQPCSMFGMNFFLAKPDIAKIGAIPLGMIRMICAAKES